MSPAPQAALGANMGYWARETLHRLIIGMTPWEHTYHSLSHHTAIEMNLAVIETIMPCTNKVLIRIQNNRSRWINMLIQGN